MFPSQEGILTDTLRRNTPSLSQLLLAGDGQLQEARHEPQVRVGGRHRLGGHYRLQPPQDLQRRQSVRAYMEHSRAHRPNILASPSMHTAWRPTMSAPPAAAMWEAMPI